MSGPNTNVQPRDFSDIIGQQSVKQFLRSLIEARSGPAGSKSGVILTGPTAAGVSNPAKLVREVSKAELADDHDPNNLGQMQNNENENLHSSVTIDLFVLARDRRGR